MPKQISDTSDQLSAPNPSTPEATRPAVSQRELVLSKIGDRAVTSLMLAAETGLSISHCSHWLCDLEYRGIVKSIGRTTSRAKFYILATNNRDFSELTNQLNEAVSALSERTDFEMYGRSIRKSIRSIRKTIGETANG